jgi:carboxyl-terminal processing protease
MIARVAVLVAVFAGALTLGFGWRDISAGHTPDIRALFAAASGLPPAPEKLAPTRAFSTTLEAISSRYYGKTDSKSLVYAGVNGMLSALKDPHTVLLEPVSAKQFAEKNQGEFVGIGAELSPDVLGARIRRVFKNSPASEEGLRPNDIITKVGKKEVSQYKDLTDVVQDIRGAEGTYADITVYRESDKRSIRYHVERRQVQIQDVYGEVLSADWLEGQPKIGRLEVRTFQETIVRQFDQELESLEEQGIQGLVIDLRSNPGGLLSAAVEMSARFLPDKLIATMKRRDGAVESFVSPPGLANGREYPVTILVDESTASAAEIFAGAMRDWHRATIVGEHTYGKGSVQIVRALPDGAQVKLTIAKYYLPRGESVQRVEGEYGEYLGGGILPDMKVERKPSDVPGRLASDGQLRSATQYLLSQLKK